MGKENFIPFQVWPCTELRKNGRNRNESLLLIGEALLVLRPRIF